MFTHAQPGGSYFTRFGYITEVILNTHNVIDIYTLLSRFYTLCRFKWFFEKAYETMSVHACKIDIRFTTNSGNKKEKKSRSRVCWVI